MQMLEVSISAGGQLLMYLFQCLYMSDLPVEYYKVHPV